MDIEPSLTGAVGSPENSHIAVGNSESVNSFECIDTWRAIGVVASPFEENRMIVPAMVQSVQAPALVDSGATLSMVTHQWLEGNQIPLSPVADYKVHGFGVGNKVDIIGTVTLQLKLQNLVLREHSFRVIIANVCH